MKGSGVYTYVENHGSDSCQQTDIGGDWGDSNSAISLAINDVFPKTVDSTW